MDKRTSDQVVRVRLRDPPVNYAYLVVPASGYQAADRDLWDWVHIQYAVIHQTSKQDADHPLSGMSDLAAGLWTTRQDMPSVIRQTAWGHVDREYSCRQA